MAALFVATRIGARLFGTYNRTFDLFSSSDEEDEGSGRETDLGSSSSRNPKQGGEKMQNVLAHEITKASSVNDETLKRARSKQGKKVHTVSMLAGREINVSRNGKFSRADACHLTSRYLPVEGPTLLMQRNSRAYISQFSNDGSLLVAGFQDRAIVVLDTRQWTLRKSVIARNLRWTVTDTALSPDQRFLVYSSINSVVYLVNLGNDTGGTESLANVTDIHEGLSFAPEDDSFGIWSLKFSSDGTELVAGSNDNAIYVYDLGACETTYRVAAHADEVNAVAFADETGNLIYSGSDDNLCKVWDRRSFSAHKPVGTLAGHLAGITFIDSRGDGRHFISNSKDQSIKLWDIRTMSSSSKYEERRVPAFKWDYRYMKVPARMKNAKHPGDLSVMTYKGHEVLQTLIRCYFSPVISTAQKYIYTGSYNGDIYVYDVITGQVINRMAFHGRPVRDCSWHPWEPILASSCWRGCLAKWDSMEGAHFRGRETIKVPSYFESDDSD